VQKKFTFNKLLVTTLLFVCFSGITIRVYGQVPEPVDSLKSDSLGPKGKKISPPRTYDLGRQFDFGDLLHDVLHPKTKRDTAHRPNNIVIVPNIAANPTIGFQGGIKAVAATRLGNDPNTLLSVGATSASITTKGIIYFYINHNIFTPGNKFNFQGNFVVSKTVTPDEGFGIGDGKDEGTTDDEILADPTHKAYAIHSYYFKFNEKVYKRIAKGLFLGAGAEFDIRRDITQADTVNNGTPMSVYNNRFGFPQDHYAADGFLFNLEYTSRDNPNRAYKGWFMDIGFRINQTWIGSTQNSEQFTTDIRKYISLSATSPEFVLALWNWGSYLLGGEVPYLELPGSIRDFTFRSDRGYTTQFFKGTEFNDSEAELRFPILNNKFLSGVVFGNLQTGNDLQGVQIFQVFQPGGGAGLRILFNKVTRTNLALDYAWGVDHSRGFFLNLNESF
jgi:hypothetical protein